MSAARTSVQAVEWDQGINEAWTSIADFVPKLLVFLVIMFVGWLVAKAVSKVVGLVLERVGFDRLIDRAGISRFFEGATMTPLTLISKLVYYFVLLIALQLALSAFGPTNPVSAIVNDIVAWLPRAIVAIVIVVIAAAVASAVKEMVGAALGGLSYGPMLAKIVGGFIVALGVIAALNQIGVGLTVTTPVLVAVLATVAGVIIVGVGGGLVRPMSQRWEGWLNQIETDTQSARDYNRQTSGRQAEYTQPQTTAQQSRYASHTSRGETSSGSSDYAPGAGYGDRPMG